MFKSTNDEKSGAETRQRSKKKKLSNENEVGDELTIHGNDIPKFKGTNDKKSGAENREKSRKKNRKAIQDEAVQEKTKKG